MFNYITVDNFIDVTLWSWSYGSLIENYRAFSAYIIYAYIVSSNATHGEWHSIQQYVIKFVSYFRQVGG